MIQQCVLISLSEIFASKPPLRFRMHITKIFLVLSKFSRFRKKNDCIKKSANDSVQLNCRSFPFLYLLHPYTYSKWLNETFTICQHLSFNLNIFLLKALCGNRDLCHKLSECDIRQIYSLATTITNLEYCDFYSTLQTIMKVLV